MTTDRSPARTVCAGFEVPALPDLLRRVLAVAADPHSSSRDLERVISEDPGLVMQLLRTVNSTYYGLRTPVAVANQAIVLLGIPVVVNLVSGLLLIDAFANQPGLAPDRVRAVWRHALACSGLVNVLARHLSGPQRDLAYLAALTQNVGQLVLARHFQARYAALPRCGAFPAHVAERRRLGVDHAEVGAHLLAAWHYPPAVAAIVAAHHEPGRDAGDGRQVLLVGLADALAQTLVARADYLTSATTPAAACRDRLERLGWTWPELLAARDDLLRPVAAANGLVAAHTR